MLMRTQNYIFDAVVVCVLAWVVAFFAGAAGIAWYLFPLVLTGVVAIILALSWLLDRL